MSDDNIIRFGSVQGGKTDDEKFPNHQYEIIDIDDNEFYAEGYLIFTSHHVCVMEDSDNGPVAALMIPLHRVKVVEIADVGED